MTTVGLKAGMPPRPHAQTGGYALPVSAVTTAPLRPTPF
jgi:hypothetical protein